MADDGAWTIVLIDDEEDIRDVMTLSLTDAGYRVSAASDGAAGVELCRRLIPEIVITDVRMPGMDGLQVLEALKEEFSDVEVIVATAFGEMELAIRALQLDASDFITKPIGEEALSMALARAKERYRSRKQLKDYASLLEKENAATSQELMKTIAFQRNLIESSMDGILGCDPAGRVMIYNRSMAQIAGYPRDLALGKLRFGDFFTPGDAEQLLEALHSERYGGSNRLFLFETNLKGQDGRSVPVQVSAAAIEAAAGSEGLVCFLRDLRRLRRLEREMADQARILHQDKMMSLGRLAASVVHEINNPLAGILNYLRLMIRILNKGESSAEHGEKFRRYLELVEKETARCSQIVSNLLSFSRISTPSFEAIRIDELLQRCVLLSRHKLELSHIELEVRVSDDLPWVRGDLNQLQQCVINLIFNAVDAMPEGGKMVLDARCDAAAQQAVIAVSDTGAGIAPEHLTHIFEPFFTTKQEGSGTGLGLSTVFGIMERHRGSVTVENRPGEGATFFLKLPIAGRDREGLA
jgi:PAS domain S-box-containing protein